MLTTMSGGPVSHDDVDTILWKTRNVTVTLLRKLMALIVLFLTATSTPLKEPVEACHVFAKIEQETKKIHVHAKTKTSKIKQKRTSNTTGRNTRTYFICLFLAFNSIFFQFRTKFSVGAQLTSREITVSKRPIE